MTDERKAEAAHLIDFVQHDERFADLREEWIIGIKCGDAEVIRIVSKMLLSTTDETDDEMEWMMMLPEEAMPAPAIEALELSRDRLTAYYEGGELNHLTSNEIAELFDSAYQRDMQRTIIRED